jgi:hypothetical protein
VEDAAHVKQRDVTAREREHDVAPVVQRVVPEYPRHTDRAQIHASTLHADL